MKVGYLVSQYPAINHTFVLREIRELRSLGFDVLVVSVRRPDRPLAEMTPVEADEARRTAAVLGMPLTKILRTHLTALIRRPLGYLRGLAAALGAGGTSIRSVLLHMAYFAEAVVAGDLFLRAGIDHFHVHFSSTVGWLAVKVFPLSMSITFHGMEFLEPPSYRLREKIEQSLFVRGISSFGASRMMMLTPVADWPKIEMVRLGVDISAFRPADHTGDGVELLCVGRLSAEKGHHILLDALALVVAEYRAVTIRLRLVGDGPDRAALAQHAEKLGIQEHVIFEGWANHDRVLEFYQRADIFLLASFAEGIPVVLMEAMAMELPVVATWISGIPELVDSGQNGLLCAPGDADALAANIHKLISDPDLRKRLGAAGRRTVLDQFDLAANAKEWAAVLRRRLSARGEPIPMRAIEDP